MFKWLFLIVGLGVGFGGGVFWSVRNPSQASKLSDQEQRQVYQQTKALKEKVAHLLNKPNGATTTPADADLKDLNDTADNALNTLKKLDSN